MNGNEYLASVRGEGPTGLGLAQRRHREIEKLTATRVRALRWRRWHGDEAELGGEIAAFLQSSTAACEQQRGSGESVGSFVTSASGMEAGRERQ
jgi:hypothetical protein